MAAIEYMVSDVGGLYAGVLCEQFDVVTVTLLLILTAANKFSVGCKEVRCAVT
jgi:hypothetical protein